MKITHSFALDEDLLCRVDDLARRSGVSVSHACGVLLERGLEWTGAASVPQPERRAYHRATLPYAPRPGTWPAQVLLAMSGGGAWSPAELAMEIGCRREVVGSVLKELHRRGVVSRPEPGKWRVA